jgi:hypothetical protein
VCALLSPAQARFHLTVRTVPDTSVLSNMPLETGSTPIALSDGQTEWRFQVNIGTVLLTHDTLHPFHFGAGSIRPAYVLKRACVWAAESGGLQLSLVVQAYVWLPSQVPHTCNLGCTVEQYMTSGRVGHPFSYLHRYTSARVPFLRTPHPPNHHRHSTLTHCHLC